MAGAYGGGGGFIKYEAAAAPDPRLGCDNCDGTVSKALGSRGGFGWNKLIPPSLSDWNNFLYEAAAGEPQNGNHWLIFGAAYHRGTGRRGICPCLTQTPIPLDISFEIDISLLIIFILLYIHTFILLGFIGVCQMCFRLF